MGNFSSGNPGIQTYTVGTSGTYDITADGAQGGQHMSSGPPGGAGAVVSGDVYLQSGTVLEIVVGGEGGDGVGFFEGGGGGGGGSFVIEVNGSSLSDDTILAVAGGGGGGGYGNQTDGAGSNGGTNPTGGHGGRTNAGAGGLDGAAGKGGFAGGGGGGFTGGGGGGGGTGGHVEFYAQNGADTGQTFSGGSGTTNGGGGGIGGGGGGGRLGAGGGGGYGGGGGGGEFGGGGGGGSYFDTALVTNVVETGGAHSGSGFVSVVQVPVCYVSGTRLLTDEGEVAIEQLAVGDLVVTASGAPRPVRWLGHRRVDCARHPEPWSVWPVRIQAGAFAQDLPARDLWVSPGHSILINGVLIPAGNLVNGATIVQVPLESVEYWHVELESHDVLIAEGLAAESYLDTGNRAAFFNNGGSYLEAHPDFKPKHWAETCMPLVLEGPEIHQAKAQLLARAQALGCVITEDSDAHIIADGQRIEALRLGERRLAFVLPEAMTAIELSCRSFIPAHTVAQSQDQRALGVCVKRLQIDGSDVALADEAALSTGWHKLELSTAGQLHRWTHARTPLPAGTRLVVIDYATSPNHRRVLRAPSDRTASDRSVLRTASA